MTIQEKAIEQLERISEHLSAIGEKEDYTDIAIKALEQKDVLEKVRAEIVQMNDDVSKMLMPFDSIEKVKYTTGFIDGLGSTLDVIDKYREGGAE